MAKEDWEPIKQSANSDWEPIKGTSPPPAGVPAARDEGEIRQGVKPWKYKVSDIAREGLKGLGIAAGAAAGIPADIPTFGASSVAGAGLGYAIGNKAADIVDYGLGINKGAPIAKQATNAAKDVMTGASYEMGGRAVAPAIESGIKPVKNFLQSPTTKAKVQAGDILGKAYGMGPEESANAAKAESLQKRVGVPSISKAQQIGGRKAGMFEQSLSADSSIADTLTKQDTAARQGSLEYMMNTMGKGWTGLLIWMEKLLKNILIMTSQKRYSVTQLYRNLLRN